MDPASELARQIAEIFMSPMQQVGAVGNQALQYGNRLKDMMMGMMQRRPQQQQPPPFEY